MGNGDGDVGVTGYDDGWEPDYHREHLVPSVSVGSLLCTSKSYAIVRHLHLKTELTKFKVDKSSPSILEVPVFTYYWNT